MRRFAGLGGAVAGAALACLAGSIARAGEAHQVIIEKFAFSPALLEIRQGDAVTFLNKDLAPHTASAIGAGWETGQLGKGRSATIRFTHAGTMTYRCAYHPHMTARIVVLAD